MKTYQKPYKYIKTLLDQLCAIVLIVITSPIMVLIAGIIKLESDGPVIYEQERVGYNGKIFRIYKFRTMVDKAILQEGGICTHDNDPRITKVGSFLRKTSLDELPQFFNVLKGEMSFIGPRPPLPFHPRPYKDYSADAKRRFLVKPGISGYAQVVLRNNSTWDQRFVLDSQYVDRMSFLFDAYIVARTFLTLIKRENIYKKT